MKQKDPFSIAGKQRISITGFSKKFNRNFHVIRKTNDEFKTLQNVMQKYQADSVFFSPMKLTTKNKIK